MTVRHISILLSFWAFLSLATPLDITEDQALEESNPPDVTGLNPPSSLNASAPVLDTSRLSAGLEIECNGTQYGHYPPISDCRTAIDWIAPDITQLTFGQRHTGLPHDVFPLPYISMGSKSTD